MSTIFIDSMNNYNQTNMWDRFKNVHFNTGNIVFSESCKNEINYKYTRKLDELNWNEMSKNDVYVLPLSNNFSVEDTNFTRLLYKLARYKLNIVPIGLGVQANVGELPKDYIKKIPSRKKHLIQRLSLNTNSIGVRGEFTAECLKLIGIHNVRIIGCPSFYSNIVNYEDCENEIKLKRKYSDICVNWDFNSYNDFQYCSDKNYTIKYVIQTMPEYVKHKRNGYNSQIFFSLNEWGDWIKDNKFVVAIGNRFHGNMMCYLNGVPTIWGGIDMRMLELIKVFKLPYVDNIKVWNVDEIMNENMYSKEFYENRKYMRNKYISFLNENCIDNKFNGV